MEHSKNYDKVKKYYDEGFWTKKRVHDAVTNPKSNPWITPNEYFEITEEPYEE